MFKELNSTTRLAIKLAIDATAFAIAFVLGYVIRFTWDDCLHQLFVIGPYLPLFLVVRLTSFASFRLYSTMWRYSAVHSLTALVKASAIGTLAIIIVNYFLVTVNIPRSVILIDFFGVVFLAGGARLLVRYMNAYDRDKSSEEHSAKRVLIYGAGDAGEQLLRNFLSYQESGLEIVGFIDDDPKKSGQYIHGKKVLGTRAQIGEVIRAHNINSVYLCIPSLSGTEARNIFNTAKELSGNTIEFKTMPGLNDLVNGRVTINQLRQVEIRDLLRRKQVSLDVQPVVELIRGKTVLVVGGAGSIGFELCQQIAHYKPKRLIIVDASEFAMYKAEATLQKLYPDLQFDAMVADACNEPLIRVIFERNHPDLVFHAAAYKHVPLMEMNPWAAVYNNLTSTMRLVDLSCEYNVERFILISSDKAVNPTSVMGATKRMCELVVLNRQQSCKTRFITVRFGNVLGSSGSVIPKFQEQIQAGGPVTVTHPDITRYFMLISEAVELVLQAGAIGEPGTIYVLDMGEPIRIADLAEYMIKLSGLRPGEDVKVEFTGLRPGEKLYESLYFEGEETPTRIPNLFVLSPKLSLNGDYASEVRNFIASQHRMSLEEVRQEIKRFIPEYILNGNG